MNEYKTTAIITTLISMVLAIVTMYVTWNIGNMQTTIDILGNEYQECLLADQKDTVLLDIELSGREH